MKRNSYPELFLTVIEMVIIDEVAYHSVALDYFVQKYGRYYNNKNINKLLNVLKRTCSVV